MSTKPKLTRAAQVFFSYAHEDEDLREVLEKHLSPLKRQGVITGWHDRKIGAGREWEGEIDEHLNTADFILLLISADFLGSDYCYDIEMRRAMKRHEDGEACVIPVILRPVDWRGAPFGKLQALPTDAKPVTSWPDRDEAFLNVAQGIRKAVEEFLPSPPSPAGAVPVRQEEAARERIALDLSHGQKGWKARGGIRLYTKFPGSHPELHFLRIEQGKLTQRQEIESSSVLVIPLPRNDVFGDEEIDYVQEWVETGGGLFLLGFYLADSHHERLLENEPRRPNINGLARVFDFEFQDDLIMPVERYSLSDCRVQSHSAGDIDLSVTKKLASGIHHSIMQGVTDVAFLSACSLGIDRVPVEYVLESPPCMVVRAKGVQDRYGRLTCPEEYDGDRQNEVPLLAAWRHGEGRIVASGTWKICTWDYGDNATLVGNILNWLSQSPGTQPA